VLFRTEKDQTVSKETNALSGTRIVYQSSMVSFKKHSAYREKLRQRIISREQKRKPLTFAFAEFVVFVGK
jgi:hypothetical protein